MCGTSESIVPGMLALVRPIVSVLAYRFRSGRRLIEAMLDNAALENLLGKKRLKPARWARMEFTTRLPGYADVRCIEHGKPRSFDVSSGK